MKVKITLNKSRSFSSNTRLRCLSKYISNLEKKFGYATILVDGRATDDGQDGVAVGVPDGRGLEVEALLEGQHDPVAHAQKRAHGEQVEDHRGRRVAQEVDAADIRGRWCGRLSRRRSTGSLWAQATRPRRA